MAKAVVLLFLLDSISDFNYVVNTTLRKLPGIVGVCDSMITEPILQVIGKKLNLSKDSVENLQNIDHNHLPSYKFQELTPESVKNIGFQENSVEESYEFSAEKSLNKIDHYYKKNYTKNEDILESMSGLKSYVENGGKAEFPENAPFLAAIFETVGNVTAQTCGGVVLSSHWVLTAASCVDVLSPFYSNSSNETLDNYYSIVAGAKNPLKDGTVHQVSKIFLHPTPKLNQSVAKRRMMKRWFDAMVGTGNITAPSLALLKVEPGISGGILQIGNNTDLEGVDARIYVWDLRQNTTGFDMMSTSLPAKFLSPSECKTAYGTVENNTTLCLMVNETATNNTRMSSGCPVLVLQNRRPAILAVALTDGSRLLASPLSAHRDWLIKFTRENYDYIDQ